MKKTKKITKTSVSKKTQEKTNKPKSGKDLFKSLVSGIGNSLVDRIEDSADLRGQFIDTGSFILNAQQSGSIYGGFPRSAISILAGEKATGKTYVLLKIAKLFLDTHPDAAIIIFESEFATHEEDLIKRGIDPNRCRLIRVRTVQEFHRQANKYISDYIALPKSQRFPTLIGLDSAGMLSTTKEIDDLSKGDEKVDMTKAKLMKAVFRTFMIPLGVAGIPMVITNHVYRDQSGPNPKYARNIMSGGEGIYYAATSVVFFSKTKDRDTQGGHVGSIISSSNEKCRKAIEGTRVQLKVHFKKGLDRYYGLLDYAEDAELVSKVGNKYQFKGHDKSYSESVIYKHPKKFFTKSILNAIDQHCQQKFSYGTDNDDTEDLLSKDLSKGMDLSMLMES